ncbi:hypothetical protein I3760_12G099100 [Carya illinoinensis]|nr:hypothetical protein I3760_12G099100 [Carya illinoinensis]
MLRRLLWGEYQLIDSSEDLISYILAGMGYALSSSVNVHYVKILDSLFGIWGREGGPHGSVSHGLMCFSLALARSGLVSAKAPLLICLASALSTEIFPSRRLYTKLLDFPHANSVRLGHDEVKKHVDSVPFKEAGAMIGVFCNLYASVDVESKCVVENLLWDYYQDIYWGHRRAAFLLRGREDELLRDMEKIAESAFLMVVLFALTVTKYKLNSKFSQATHKDISENESAIVSFVESMPSYTDLANGPDFSSSQKMEYVWYKDGVQTACILFYLRVIPTCIDNVPIFVLRKVVAPTMFLHMGNPNGKVARSSHSMFSAFISSGKDSDQDERVSLKEQLAFYYMQRSLLVTKPTESISDKPASLLLRVWLQELQPWFIIFLLEVQPFCCVHSLVEKANTQCGDIFSQETVMGKNWHGESEPCKKILELLLRLISLVDIQVLPHLMKLLAQLVVQLSKDGQNMGSQSAIFTGCRVWRCHTQSWLQSLSYLCDQATSRSATYKGMERVKYDCRTGPLLLCDLVTWVTP